MMRVLVCGGRDFDDRKFVFAQLDKLHAQRSFSEVIEGGARGADELARKWAHARGIDVVTFWANWTKFDKGAGPARNYKMLMRGAPDLVVAFPGGSGTANMVEQADFRKVEVVSVSPPSA